MKQFPTLRNKFLAEPQYWKLKQKMYNENYKATGASIFLERGNIDMAIDYRITARELVKELGG